MLRKGNRGEDEYADSGAETAESDCSKMSSSGGCRVSQNQDVLLMTMHLLANPGESFLLQQTLDQLFKWVSPELRLFHVSERACPVKDSGRPRAKASVYPSLSVTLFLHEDYGEERILRVQDFFQRPPWQYHHSESAGGKFLPYLLSSRDFYSLDSHMPVWAVRPVHCGDEIVRVTLYCRRDNYEDAVRMYGTILRREAAAAQKSGFCFFPLCSSAAASVQLALKQLPPGVSVDVRESAVLQFTVREIGQLVPLLPNPCYPISSTRWQTEDYDGNKILFQVNVPLHSQHNMTSAFPVSSQQTLRNMPKSLPSSIPAWPVNKWSPSYKERRTSGTGVEEGSGRSPPDQRKLGPGGVPPKNERVCSDSCCSTPRSSSCYSSQRSSPAVLSWCEPHHEHGNPPPACCIPADSTAGLLEEEESETNVDTGFTVLNQDGLPGHSKLAFSGFPRDLCNSLPDTRTLSCASPEQITKRLPISTTLNSCVCSSKMCKSSTSGFKREGQDHTEHCIPKHCLPPIQAKYQNVQVDEFFI
uniref:Family with sequence similarity 124 member B n=1 Tax=Lepisosteus oculatus TaxID=7918 RepID=W5M8P2_LEPOC|nr:PREDICTED: protein FAM124B isoform X1 [Lepisosteus oculatus]XP_015216421.1 PREDICTED: protein FAM124B isoform X1 [Lepisosteus oculatus]